MSSRYLHRPLLFAVALAVTGCDRGPRSEEAWRDTGFVRHVSSGTEAYLSLRQPAGKLSGLARAAAPLWSDPGMRASWSRSPAGKILEPFFAAPPTMPFLATVAASADEELFLAFGPGTATQLAALQQIKRLFEAARVRNLFTPMPVSDLVPPGVAGPTNEWPEDLEDAAFTEVMVPLPPAMQEALENFVRHAAIPPMVAGVKLAPEDERLPSFLADWVKQLPAKIPRDAFDAGEYGKFTRVRLPVMSVVPREAAVRARDFLAANIGDPFAATYIIRDLMGKTTTLCFGRAHGYFIVTVGLDDPRSALATRFEDSLPASGALDRLPALIGADNLALVYANALLVSLAAAPPPVAEYLDAALESALEFAPAGKIRQLREAAAPLRAQAEELFHPRVAPLSGVIREPDGRWQAELFGGSFAPRLSMENEAPLLATDGALALLWTEHWEPGYAGRLTRFASGVTAFADAWLDALGPVFLEDATRDRAGRLLGIFSATTAPFRGEDAALLEKALSNNVALAVGLDGIMPRAPFAPAAASRAVLPRAAIATGLLDREVLRKLREVMGAESSGSGLPMLPSAVETTSDSGAVTFSYPVPLAGPDLGPAVTLHDRRWVLGTSPSFTDLVATLPAPPRSRSSVQTIKVNTASAAAFANAWAAAMEDDPSVAELTSGLMPSDPVTLRAVAGLLQQCISLTYEARWEKDNLRRVISLDQAP